MTGLLVLTGCSGLQGTGDKGYVTGDGLVQTVAVGERDAPIRFEGQDLDGKALSIADFRGAPVVVTVWGSWCTDCRAEAADVVAAARELEGVAEFVGIDARDPSAAQAAAYERTHDVPYRSIYSPSGDALLAFPGVLTLQSVPSFVVLDAEGRVAASINGSLPSMQTLVDLAQDVADEKTSDG